jgi:[ribosomal protein S5]-alanine N-acetyltransferase
MGNINYNNIKIETKHLILRPLKKSDAVSITKYLQEKAISDNTMNIPYPYSLEDGYKFIKISKANKKRLLFTLDFGIYHKELKEVIGNVSLTKIDLKNKNCESGSWIGKPFWGSGLIHEAKIEMYKFAFDKLKLRKIYSKVFSFNPRSFKHLEKLGFVRQGLYRKHLFLNNKFIDECYYEMLKEEFKYKDLKEKLLKG